jgi:hypothetical protein
MNSKRPPSMLLAAMLVATVGLALAAPGGLSAQETIPQEGTVVSFSFDDGLGCQPWEYGDPALFHNFYAPNNCGGAPAQLYIAPRPVPPLVGHTYYTYQPFMPHEFTYSHYRTYRHYYDDGRGMTRAKAVWYCNPLTEALKGARQAVRLPR